MKDIIDKYKEKESNIDEVNYRRKLIIGTIEQLLKRNQNSDGVIDNENFMRSIREELRKYEFRKPNTTFSELCYILQKCNSYDVAKFVCYPYIIDEITDKFISYSNDYLFLTNGLVMIQYDKSDKILEINTFDYTDVSSSSVNTFYRNVAFSVKENRFRRLMDFVKEK